MAKIAIIGTGGMAPFHAKAFRQVEGCELVAVCDIDREKATAFADAHGGPSVFTDADQLLADSDCEAVAIVTPDSSHHPLALKVIAAGRHVLCEKPLSLDYERAAGMRDAAVSAGVVNMVHFTYRNSPAIQKAAAMVAAGELGTIRHVHAHYHQSWLVQDAWGDWRTSPGWLWRLSTGHGSAGVLGDIGIHLLDFASMPLGSLASVHCRLKTFAKPEGETVAGYRLDANDSAVITAEFANGALGVLHTTRWAYPHVNSLRLNLYGDRATLEIDLDRSRDSLRINRIDGRTITDWETLDCGTAPTIQERFIRAIESGIPEQPDFARGAEIQAVLDACRQSAETDATVRIPGSARVENGNPRTI